FAGAKIRVDEQVLAVETNRASDELAGAHVVNRLTRRPRRDDVHRRETVPAQRRQPRRASPWELRTWESASAAHVKVQTIADDQTASARALNVCPGPVADAFGDRNERATLPATPGNSRPPE